MLEKKTEEKKIIQARTAGQTISHATNQPANQAISQTTGQNMMHENTAAMHDSKLEDKISPIIDGMMKNVLGVRVEELSKDISDKILKKPLLNFEVNTALPFSRAKKAFKKAYLMQLLRTHYGNISEVAKTAGINRRSIHRLLKTSYVEKIRRDMPNPVYIKKENLSDAITDVLENYKKIIHPKMLKEVYKSVPGMSEDILKAVPESPMTLEEAEKEFEKEYFKKLLEENKFNIKKAAEKSKLRYETLLRKLKSLGISSKALNK